MRINHWEPAVSSSDIKKDGRGKNPAVSCVPIKPCNRLDAVDDLAEDVTDGGTKNGQNDDDYDSDQNQDQGILDQTLAFFLHFLEHGICLLSIKITERIDYVCIFLYIISNLSKAKVNYEYSQLMGFFTH